MRGGGGGGGAVRFRPDTKSGGGEGGGTRFRHNTKSGGGGGGGGCCLLQARYEKRGGGTVHLRPDTKSGGGGGVLSGASGPIQKAGKGEGLFSRRGGVTIYERGGCNPQTPPPHPGSASEYLYV